MEPKHHNQEAWRSSDSTQKSYSEADGLKGMNVKTKRSRRRSRRGKEIKGCKLDERAFQAHLEATNRRKDPTSTPSMLQDVSCDMSNKLLQSLIKLIQVLETKSLWTTHGLILLKIIIKAESCITYFKEMQIVLRSICSYRVLDTYLPRIIDRLDVGAEEGVISDEEVVDDVKTIYVAISKLSQRFPSQGSKLSALLKDVSRRESIVSILRHCNPSLEESIRQLVARAGIVSPCTAAAEAVIADPSLQRSTTPCFFPQAGRVIPKKNTPGNLSTSETTTVAKPYTTEESSGHVPVLPAATSLNSHEDKSIDTAKHEVSEYSSSSPKPPLSVHVSLEITIPLTALETDDQIHGHKLRLSKSDTALSQMDAAHPAKPKRSSSVHNVGHRNTLRHNLKSKIPNTAVLEPHSLDPKKNPSVGNPPPPISRKFWESSFTLSSAGGTVQKPGSDVILNVPPNAVDKDAKIDVYTAVCTDMDRVRRILNLPGDECVSSPLAEYWAGHEFRFKKPVSIKLPTFLPPNPDLQLVRVYRVAYRCDGQLAITRLRPREKSIHTVHLSDEHYTKQTSEADPHVPTTSRKGPIGQVADCAGSLPWETDGYFWLSSDGQVIINTDHFCGYVCTYCNLQQGPPVLEAIVSGSHTREEEGQQSAQITLYIWDKRLYIKDFQQGNGFDFKQIVEERSFSLRAFSDQLQRSKVHVRLGLVGLDKADWQHVMDDGCPTLPPEQQCDLGELLSCNDENCCAAKAAFRCPLSFDWWLESKPGCQPRSVLRCVVDIIHLKPDEHPVWTFEDTTKRLPVRILRRTDPSESCTQADSRQSSASPPTPSSPPEHVVPTWMGTTTMYGQPPDHPVPQNHQRPQNSSYETMNNHNIGDVGSLTSSAADGHSTPAKIVARDHSFSSPEGAVGGLRHPGEHATQDQLSGFPGASTSSRTLFSGGPSQSGHQAMEMPAELPSFAQIQGVPCRYQGDAMSAEHCGLAGQQVEASNGHGLSTCSLPSAAGGDSHRVTQNIVIINKPINNHHYNNIRKIQGDPTFASSVTNHSGPRIENDDHTSMHAVPYREGSTGGAQSFQSPAVDVARRYLELHGDLQVIGQPELGYGDPSLNPQRGTNLTDMRNPLCSPSQ